jgi:hypothetical protein
MQLPAVLHMQELFVYNRTASKAQALTSNPDLSIQLAASPAEMAAACSIICLMLAGANALQTVQLETPAIIVRKSLRYGCGPVQDCVPFMLPLTAMRCRAQCTSNQ